MVISYLNGLLAVNMNNPIIHLPPLPDIGFEHLPQIPNSYPNILLIAFCIYFSLRFFRWKNLNSILKLVQCITVLFTIRLLTFPSTIVPPSTTGCANRNETAAYEWNVLRVLIFSDDNTCVDYMFSGHASYFILIYLFTLRLSQNFKEKLIMTMVTILGLASIIAGHIHYTVDVIVGLILSIGTYFGIAF